MNTPPVETWMLYGSHWRLPVEVAWTDYELRIATVWLHTAVPWLKCWKAVAAKSLDSAGVGSDGTRWSFEREGLSRVAVPTTLEPEKVIRWSTEEEAYELDMEADYTDIAGNKETALRVRAFLRRMVDKLGLSGFESIDELEVFYYLLTHFMMRELIERNEPVELVFARLWPNPLKPGWQGGRRRMKMEAFVRKARNGLLVGSDSIKRNERKQALHRWRLEVIANPRWIESSRRAEANRLKLYGEFGYITQNRARMEAVWPTLLEALAIYRKEKQAPCLASTFFTFRDVKIAPKTGRIVRARPGRLGKKNVRSQAALDGINAAGAAARIKKREAKMASANAGVPTVPDLRSPAQDLRDGGGNDAQSAGGTTERAAGLLVPFTDQEPAGESELLGLGKKPGDGVA